MLVKEFLGHASLENTLLYIQIEQAVFGVNIDDEYEVNATNNKEEIKKLFSVGFNIARANFESLPGYHCISMDSINRYAGFFECSYDVYLIDRREEKF